MCEFTGFKYHKHQLNSYTKMNINFTFRIHAQINIPSTALIRWEPNEPFKLYYNENRQKLAKNKQHFLDNNQQCTHFNDLVGFFWKWICTVHVNEICVFLKWLFLTRQSPKNIKKRFLARINVQQRFVSFFYFQFPLVFASFFSCFDLRWIVCFAF